MLLIKTNKLYFVEHAKILKVKLPDIEKQRKLYKQSFEDPAALKEEMKKPQSEKMPTHLNLIWFSASNK